MAHEAKLTIQEASRYSGFSTATIGHAAKLDPPRLRAYRAGPTGPYYFTRTDLDAWVRSMETPAPQQAKKRQKAGSK